MSAAESGVLPSAERAWAATGIVLAAGLSAFAVVLVLGFTHTGHPHGGVAALDGCGGGAGLLGMTERVKAHGGQLSAGPVPGGGWRITAACPRALTWGYSVPRMRRP